MFELVPLAQIFNRPEHGELLESLARAHNQAARDNNNTSTAVAVATYKASGNLGNALAAAALAQGGLHAPIAQARALLASSDIPASIRRMFEEGRRVPGMGNSFHKHAIDPAFISLFYKLPPAIVAAIHEVWETTVQTQPKLCPNAAIITAGACIAANLPHGVESAVFTICRQPAWVKACLAHRSPRLGHA